MWRHLIWRLPVASLLGSLAGLCLSEAIGLFVYGRSDRFDVLALMPIVGIIWSFSTLGLVIFGLLVTLVLQRWLEQPLSVFCAALTTGAMAGASMMGGWVYLASEEPLDLWILLQGPIFAGALYGGMTGIAWWALTRRIVGRRSPSVQG